MNEGKRLYRKRKKNIADIESGKRIMQITEGEYIENERGEKKEKKSGSRGSANERKKKKGKEKE